MAGRSVIFLLCSLFYGVLAKDRVPVLIWNPTQKQESRPAVPALQSLDYATFQSKYLTDFEQKDDSEGMNILLFLQDCLSVEDLSSHSAEFQPLSEWMATSHSLYLPNVEDPAHLIHDLPSRGYSVVSLEPGVPAAGLDLKQQDKNLVVVKLPSTLTNPSRSHALQKSVEVMQNAISKIGAKKKFTIMYTAKKPSVEDNSEKYEEHLRVRRALRTTQERGFHSVNCVMLYFKQNFTFWYQEKPEVDPIEVIIDDEPSLDNGHCDDPKERERTATISMKFTEGLEHFSRLIFSFNFKAVGSSWAFTDVDVVKDNLPTKYNLALEYPDITGIPIGMSYSCSEKIRLSSNETTTEEKMAIVMEGVQMEAFFDYSAGNSTTFSPAWDCVGFFTVPIWVSLLTTLLLLIILTTGLYMLSDIKTMDRFDDPKGQPIMVPVSE